MTEHEEDVERLDLAPLEVTERGDTAQGERGQWLDGLLPPDLPPEIDRLLNLSFRDGGDTFRLGAADQLIAALIRAVFQSRATGRHLIIGLPRGANDLAILTGFLGQLLRIQVWQESAGAGALAFGGPVVVIARDTAVQQRLSLVKLRGMTFRSGMAGAVSACRVRADGRIVEPDGTPIRYSSGSRRLLYLNSRVGWPQMDVWDGFGVIDRATLRDPKSYRLALEWTRSRCARTITIAELDDPETQMLCREAGLEPFLFPMTPAVLADLQYVIGSAPGTSKLTANPLLTWAPSIHLHPVSNIGDLERLLRTGFSALSAARETSHDAKYPLGVRVAARLLATIQSCVVDLDAYGREASGDPRVRFGSPRSMRLALERSSGAFYGPWEAFGATDWMALRNAALRAYDECVTRNPKQEALVDALDLLRRRSPAARLLIRVPNRAAARVLTNELSDQGLLDGRTQVAAWSARRPWLADDMEIWCGVPPGHHRTMLFSAEATHGEVLSYRGEAIAFLGAVKGAARRIGETISAAAEWFRIEPPPADVISVAPLPATTDDPGEAAPLSFDVDFDRVIAAASEVLADIGETDESSQAQLSDETEELMPVGIGDGLVWWLASDDAVGTLVNDHYRHRLVSDLEVGDLVVVPRGEGREELFTRLVEAVHRFADVTDLDRMLARFRKACADVYVQSGQNWAEANRSLKMAGAGATSQIRQWASGETIAPQDGGDVRIVARLAHDRELEERWKSVEAVARELRGLHIKLGRVVSGALREALDGEGPFLEKVRSMLDSEGLEILDEFAVHEVASIGEPRQVAASQHGSVTKDNS